MSEPGYDVDPGDRAGDAADDDHYDHQQNDIQQDSGPHESNGADINQTNKKKKKKKQRMMMMILKFQGRGSGGAGHDLFLESRRVSLFPFAKTKKYLSPSANNANSRKRPPFSSSSSSSSSSTGSCLPKAGNCTAKAGMGTCFCLKQPRISESPVGSHSSDPNDPSFTLDKLQSLIEKNHFYAHDCNPHLDSI